MIISPATELNNFQNFLLNRSALSLNVPYAAIHALEFNSDQSEIKVYNPQCEKVQVITYTSQEALSFQGDKAHIEKQLINQHFRSWILLELTNKVLALNLSHLHAIFKWSNPQGLQLAFRTSSFTIRVNPEAPNPATDNTTQKCYNACLTAFEVFRWGNADHPDEPLLVLADSKGHIQVLDKAIIRCIDLNSSTLTVKYFAPVWKDFSFLQKYDPTNGGKAEFTKAKTVLLKSLSRDWVVLSPALDEQIERRDIAVNLGCIKTLKFDANNLSLVLGTFTYNINAAIFPKMGEQTQKIQRALSDYQARQADQEKRKQSSRIFSAQIAAILSDPLPANLASCAEGQPVRTALKINLFPPKRARSSRSASHTAQLKITQAIHPKNQAKKPCKETRQSVKENQPTP